MRLFVTTLAAGTALLAATPTSASAQQASLVYRLGKDTVAIEQYTRTATGMTGEMVQRSGAAVARYQYTITLAKNGRPTTASIKRLNADGSLPPNTPSDTRFTVTADSIVRETVFADSTPRRAFAAKQAAQRGVRVYTVAFGTPQGFNTGEQFFAYLRDAFDVLYAEGAEQPKMLSIGMHCRLLGRPGRMLALQKFLDHIAKFDRVWVCKRIDIAKHWKQHHPYQENT